MEAEKSGKVKLTIELEINQPAMELIKTDMEMMSENNSKAYAEYWREGMVVKRKEGHGHGYDAPRPRI